MLLHSFHQRFIPITSHSLLSTSGGALDAFSTRFVFHSTLLTCLNLDYLIYRQSSEDTYVF